MKLALNHVDSISQIYSKQQQQQKKNAVSVKLDTF